MAKPRRKYSAEFKREAVQLTLEPGRTVAEVAANLGLNANLLQRWRSQVKGHGPHVFPGNGRPKASDEELLQLRKELARAQQERDILKNHRARSRFLLDQKLMPGLRSLRPRGVAACFLAPSSP